VLAKAFDFLHGVGVRASSLRAPTSRTTPIPFTYRGPDGAILSVDCKVKLMKGITAILPHFLAFLPDNVSQHREKSLVNGFMNKKMVKDDITTGYEAEMFASVLHPRSK
jgi:hypothetical protein